MTPTALDLLPRLRVDIRSSLAAAGCSNHRRSSSTKLSISMGSTTGQPMCVTRTPNSLAGRIGVRVARDWDVGDEGSKRKFTLWGRADVWHEFLDDPTTEFSSAAGFIPFSVDPGDSWATLGIGAAMPVSDAASLYGNVNYDVSFDGDADAWEGKVGLKIQW